MSNQRYISDTLKKKKQKKRKLKRYVFLLICIAIIALSIYLIRLPKFQINTIEINGTAFVEKSTIEKEVNTLLKKSHLILIPNSNIFIFSKKEIEQILLKNPAIATVNVHKKYFNSIYITVEEHQKQMLYCTTITNESCFYLNETGLIYAPLKDLLIPDQEIIVYLDQNQKQIGESVMDELLYKKIVQFIKSIAQSQMKTYAVYVKQDGIIELVIKGDTKIILSIYDDFESNFKNLMALFEKEVLFIDQIFTVEYIDLRFGNKVFYKNKTN